MNKRKRRLLLLLLSSFFLASCQSEEANINKTADVSNESMEASAGSEVFYISYDGEIQQFVAVNATGLIRNMKSLAWLAQRDGLEMELVGEEVTEKENTYIYQSSNLENVDDSSLIWLRISAPTDKQDMGEGTSIPETQDTLIYIQDQDLYIGIQNSDLKWQIWKLAGYGDWFKKEITIFIKIVTEL
ncbi:MAG: hypothetical protein Q4C65_02035 [Eubacteriales bacterium]|nr:hypothetical protein [Eubacteriales bacterium]